MESMFHNFNLLKLAVKIIFHIKTVNLCREVYYMWWVNQELVIQEWEYCIKSKKKIILAIIILVPNKKPQVYKEHIISFIVFSFGEGVTIIDWIEIMKLYVSNIE